MQLFNLLPRALDPAQGSETVTLLNSLFSRTHLDRRLSRRIGWRGMRPSFTHSPAWSARTALGPSVYALVFIDETADQGLITGRYALYVFPDPQEIDEQALPCDMLDIIRSDDYRDRIRDISANAKHLAAFIAAEFEMSVAQDGSGLEITLSARSSRRRRDIDAALQPSYGAFHQTAPFFALLSQSLSAALEDDGELVLFAEKVPGLKIVSISPFVEAEDPSQKERMLSISHAFGRFKGLLPGKRMKRLYFAHRPSPEEARNLPVIHVVTGFLGSGKTTFLRQWLSDLNSRERFTGVIQNEFGEVDLDSLVLRGETRVEALDEGCVCCTLADSLRPGIERLLQATPAEQFILETTGLADPMNVMYSLLALNDLVERGLLITVVDAYDLTNSEEALSAANPEGSVRLKQIMNADVILCSKADAVEEAPLERLMQALHKLNPDALVMPAFHGQAPFAVLDKFYWHKLDENQTPLTSRQTPRSAQGVESASAGLFGRTHHKWQNLVREPDAQNFDTFHLAFNREVSLAELRELIQKAGSGLRRAKGIVDLKGEGLSIVQYAAGILGHEPADEDVIKAWKRSGGTTDEQTPPGFLVFIGRQLRKPEASDQALQEASEVS